MGQWVIFSDFGDSYCIYRACELVILASFFSARRQLKRKDKSLSKMHSAVVELQALSLSSISWTHVMGSTDTLSYTEDVKMP